MHGNEFITNNAISITLPEEPKPHVGDYIEYIPDTVSESYKLYGKYSGYGISSSKPEGTDQEIKQDTLSWQILKIYEDGSMDIIGSPTSKRVYLQGAIGYNNGVYLMHDICKELYSKRSEGIEARSVSLEDFEDESNRGNWKSVRDSYTNNLVQYGKSKTYTNANYRHYPNLYAQENGSGINTTITKTNGIKNTDKYYTSLTTETSSKATSSLTVTQTYYYITISETNYGESAKVLSKNNVAYWLASRNSDCGSNTANFSLCYASTNINGGIMFRSDGSVSISGSGLRPIVSLESNVQLSIKTQGTNGTPSTFEIEKY